MRKCKIIIGIDPDVDKSGVAIYEEELDALKISSMPFARIVSAFEYIASCSNSGHYLVVVEAAWLNRSNWHLSSSDTKRSACAKGVSVGRNMQVGICLVEVARELGLNVVEQKPLIKRWRGKDGKITHEELCDLIQIQKSRTNQEERDACLLALAHAKTKTKKTWK